ncbi:MAG: trypsin-like peptidase domain-containing protein [Candidatus Eisenbacteria bacterium]|nr:trypsin-like peptidase domain-containing protein [Candidatus Eisenbacteria bacterium]
MRNRLADRSGSIARALFLLLFSFGVGAAVVFLLLRGTEQGPPRSGDEGEEPVVEARPASGFPPAVETGVTDAIDTSRRNAIVTAAERVSPSVVTVSVKSYRVVRQTPFGGSGELFSQFFRDFLPYREYVTPVANMGSGVIISPQGYVLSNAHVLEGAEQIEVVLSDGREFAAELIGTDPSYDLSVIRIEGEDLPVAPLGDSDGLVIGEWALAIGNPFGYLLNNTQPSVTVGVISAVHRDVRPGDTGRGIYKDMIQTDAAINPGNSGGPLVNARGEVVGINTFIFTKSGGSLGVGFAIPINTAGRIVEELIRYGQVRQVWVGVRVQEINARAARILGLTSQDGVLVSYVDEGSPAQETGIQVGDVIIAVNGERVVGIEEARRALFGVQVGDTLDLAVVRKGEMMGFRLTMREQPRGREQ